MFISKIYNLLNSLRKWLSKIFSMFITAFTLVSSACLTYVLIYNILIPEISYKQPLNFVFEDCVNQRCGHPLAKLDLQNDPSQFIFSRGESYEIKIDLLVPETDTNFDLGMFVLHVKLMGKKTANYYYKEIEGTLLTERKATMLKYKSPLMRTVNSLVFSPLILMGLYEESQSISTTILENYQINRHETVTNILVSINSYKLDIYDAEIVIRAKLRGFRYFMVNYPFICFVIGAISLLFPNLILYFTITSNSFENSKKRFSKVLSGINRLTVTTTEKSTETKGFEDDKQLMLIAEEETEEKSMEKSILLTSIGSESRRTSAPNDDSEESEGHRPPGSRSSHEGVATDDEGSIEILASDTSYDMCAITSSLSSSLTTSSLGVLTTSGSSRVEDVQ